MQTEGHQRFIQSVCDDITQWEQICAQSSLQALEWQPSQQRWSIKQITFHMADGFEATIQRIQQMLAEEKPWILAFDADQWALERSYQERPWSSAIEGLKTGMERFTNLVSALNETMLKRQGQQRNIAKILGLPNEVLTISDLVRFEALHVEEHLKAVRELLQTFSEGKFEAGGYS